MRTLRILAASLTLAAPGLALAQGSASQPATGSGTIFLPLVLSKTADLEFGTIIRPVTGAGSVTIDPASGARALTGQGGLLSSGSAPARAAFNVGGEGGQTFSITVPASMTMIRSGGAETIVVALTPSATSGALSGPSGGTGAASFGVGGELPIADTTVVGAYAGNFSVTVAYN